MILATLKVIGLILLALIGIFLLLFVLVLFVPVRYSLSGYRKEDMEEPIYLKAKVSWLLRIVSVSVTYSDVLRIRAKILFFTVYDNLKPKKEKRKKKSSGEESKISSEENDAKIQEKSLIEADKVVSEDFGLEEDIDINDEKELSFFEKIRHFFEKIVYTIRRFCARMESTRLKLLDFLKNLESNIEKLKSDEFRAALDLCFKQLKRIWRSIRPRKIRANISFGMKDPATTGKILEFYSILYPFIGENIYIKPDLDSEHAFIEGDFLIRGKITAFIMLIVAWKLFWDKNIRKVIKMF